jgi:serine-type D-Ala-D-Ala carboxypeptidase (penicillin-binding protein 5/6)
LKKRIEKIKLGLETWKPKRKIKFGTSEIREILSVLILIGLILGGIKLVQIIDEYQYWKSTKEIYTASVAESAVDYSFLKPFRNWNVPALEEELSARSVAIMAFDGTKEHFIFEKNAGKTLPMGSISKLVSAYVVMENYQLEQIIIISEETPKTEGIRAYFGAGERIMVKDLLYSMLIESSNDSAKALADEMGEEKFVQKMNQAVEKIGLKQTYFIDPIGLDPDGNKDPYNYSTAKDLALLTKYLLNKAETDEKIAKIFEIAKTEEYVVRFADGRKHHVAVTTNGIIKDYPDFIAAKTGRTPLAGQCFLVIIPRPKEGGYIAYVILGSSDRFAETKKLIDWSQKAFIW